MDLFGTIFDSICHKKLSHFSLKWHKKRHLFDFNVQSPQTTYKCCPRKPFLEADTGLSHVLFVTDTEPLWLISKRAQTNRSLDWDISSYAVSPFRKKV